MQEIGAALQFPYYFGHNWNSLNECITDLEWCPAERYILCITSVDQLFCAESDPKQFSVLIEVLQDAAKEWATPQSGEWARPAMPFRVVFQVQPADQDSFVKRLAALEVRPEEISVK